MQLYKRKPLIVEARLWDGHNTEAIINWVRESGGSAKDHTTCCGQLTNPVLAVRIGSSAGSSETRMFASGYWVAQDRGGRWYVFDQKYFQEQFAEVETQTLPNTTARDAAGFDISWCTQELRPLVNELLGLEAVSVDDAIDGHSWMYKPYPISTFGALVNRVVLDIDPIDKDMRGLTLLEIGCGPGTKMVLAEKVFGLYTRGFDYNRAYVQAANELLHSRGCKGHAFIADAYSGDARREYRIADIIYLNRPFVHAEQQADLERLVYDTMRSGAYVIMANYVTTPEGSWPLITQDKFAAVFRKP